MIDGSTLQSRWVSCPHDGYVRLDAEPDEIGGGHHGLCPVCGVTLHWWGSSAISTGFLVTSKPKSISTESV